MSNGDENKEETFGTHMPSKKKTKRKAAKKGSKKKVARKGTKKKAAKKR